ncbi:MAG: formylglycine-generating enzyme family protein, partial [Thermoguttaceae bacterium]|nr:formylglycine-generating enzyme family protein [Thermoguttaceae bacterium]
RRQAQNSGSGSTSGSRIVGVGSSSGGTSTGASASDWSGEHAKGTAKSLTIKGETYTFHYCPTGSFGRENNGLYTVYTVYLDGFWMLETEVTQAMWKSVMGSNPSAFSSGGNYSSDVAGMDTSNFPVENVSWNDCQEFIAKLNSFGVAPSGFKFRLPSEAEWEYACRAGARGDYAGSSLDSLGWYDDNSGDQTHKVATKSANPWGLYDMYGNVWEWCEDLYDFKYYEKTHNAQNPINATQGSLRVLRGGSWNRFAEDCRSEVRDYDDPTNRSSNLGFRLALVRQSSSSK